MSEKFVSFLTSIDVEGHECSNMYAEISEILIIKCLVEGFRVRSEKFEVLFNGVVSFAGEVLR